MLVDQNQFIQSSTATATTTSTSNHPFYLDGQQRAPSTPITPTPPSLHPTAYFDQPRSSSNHHSYHSPAAIFMNHHRYYQRDKAPNSFLLFSAKRRYESPTISSQQLIEEWKDMSKEQKAEFQNQSQCIQFTLDIDKERQLQEEQQQQQQQLEHHLYYSNTHHRSIPKMVVPSSSSLLTSNNPTATLVSRQQPSMIIPNYSEEEDHQQQQPHHRTINHTTANYFTGLHQQQKCPSEQQQSHSYSHSPNFMFQQYHRSYERTSLPASYSSANTPTLQYQERHPSFIDTTPSLYPTTAFRHPQTTVTASIDAAAVAMNTSLAFSTSSSLPAPFIMTSHPLLSDTSSSINTTMTTTAASTDAAAANDSISVSRRSSYTNVNDSTIAAVTSVPPVTPVLPAPTPTSTSSTATTVEKVKRPPNAYLLFNRDMRRKIQQEQNVAYQGLTSGEISKLISQRWKALSPEERHYYVQEEAKLKGKHSQAYTNFVYTRRSKAEMMKKQQQSYDRHAPTLGTKDTLDQNTLKVHQQDANITSQSIDDSPSVLSTATASASIITSNNNNSNSRQGKRKSSHNSSSSHPSRHHHFIKNKNSTSNNDDCSMTTTATTTITATKAAAAAAAATTTTATPGRDPRGRKKKKTDDHTLPKHPMSGYLHFAKKMRPIMKKKHPEAKLVDISRSIGEQWRAMSSTEMQPWIDIANEDKARYAREMKERSHMLQQQQYDATSKKRNNNIITGTTNQQQSDTMQHLMTMSENHEQSGQQLLILQEEDDLDKRRYSMATTATTSSTHSHSSHSTTSSSMDSNSSTNSCSASDSISRSHPLSNEKMSSTLLGAELDNDLIAKVAQMVNPTTTTTTTTTTKDSMKPY